MAGRLAARQSAGLLFRDVEAESARRASVLSIGEGDDSRIYTTTDGGRGMPPAGAGEFAFAASGTCLVTSGGRDAWFGNGGGASRAFHSRDGGHTWKVTAAPIPAAEAGGVFSLAFRNPREGVMVGGDFTAPANGGDASGFTRDGGASWRLGGDLSGYRSGVDWLTGARDADRGRADRLRRQLRRRAPLDGVRCRALRRRRLLGERPGRRRRRARPLTAHPWIRSFSAS